MDALASRRLPSPSISHITETEPNPCDTYGNPRENHPEQSQLVHTEVHIVLVS